MLNHLISKIAPKAWLCIFILFTLGMSQTQLAVASDTSYSESSKTAEELRLEELAEKQNKLYFENFATDPDDIPESEYEGGTDRYFGDLVIKDDELLLEVSGGELLVVAENTRQEQLRQQLIEFVSKNEGVPVKVGIQGRINSMSDQTTEGLYELVLINYNGLEAKATNNFFKMLEAFNDKE